MNGTIMTNATTHVQPPTGNWATRGTVAAGRGVALAGFTLAGLGLWAVFATAVTLAPLGIGLPAIPVTVRAIRRLETRVRRLSTAPWLPRRYGVLARSLLAPARPWLGGKPRRGRTWVFVVHDG